MVAGIVVVALLGYALNRLFLLLEARALAWKHGLRARGEA
jgi:ABC-type nitrate/sulfonate/bicarbonate transport system permease component